MKRTAVIVSGDRNATEDQWREHIFNAIDQRVDVVIHGDQGYIDRRTGKAHGIDTIVDRVARGTNTGVIPMPAMWGDYGRRAGPLRNAAMLRVLLEMAGHGYEIAVLAFHNDIDNSKGTGDMVRRAKAAGIHTTVLRSDGSDA
jgi:hypothetical protein